MNLRLKGRLALVAISGGDLELSVARALAAQGAGVSLGGGDPARLARTHVELSALGPGDVLSMPVDLRDEEAASDWVEHTAKAFGGLDIVVTGSCGEPARPGRPGLGFRAADYRSAIDADLLPHISLTLAALPVLSRGSGGRILMITPSAVPRPPSARGLRAVTGTGLLGYAEGLVHTLGPSRVTLNVLAPGLRGTFALAEHPWAAAEPGTALAAERVRRAWARDRAIGSAGVGDFGALAAFLAGDTASVVTATVFGGGATDGPSPYPDVIDTVLPSAGGPSWSPSWDPSWSPSAAPAGDSTKG